VSESPKLGDTIRTATPMKCDTPLYRAGDFLRVRLDTTKAVDEARKLIAAGRWVVEQPKGGVMSPLEISLGLRKRLIECQEAWQESQSQLSAAQAEIAELKRERDWLHFLVAKQSSGEISIYPAQGEIVAEDDTNNWHDISVTVACEFVGGVPKCVEGMQAKLEAALKAAKGEA
jgi:hypothetical protein